MIEYQQIESTLYLSTDDLNKLGADGWELAWVITDSDGGPYTRYIFMRRTNDVVIEPDLQPETELERQLQESLRLLRTGAPD